MGDADLRTAADAYIVALDAWRAAMSGDWHDPDLPDRCSAAQGHMDAMERALRAALAAAAEPLTVADIPADVKALIDEAAGRRHSDDGAVMATFVAAVNLLGRTAPPAAAAEPGADVDTLRDAVRWVVTHRCGDPLDDGFSRALAERLAAVTEPPTETPEPGRWTRLNEALTAATTPLREDFEWLVREHERLRTIMQRGKRAEAELRAAGPAPDPQGTDERLLAQIDEHRNDPEFMGRIRASINRNRDLLDRLAPVDGPEPWTLDDLGRAIAQVLADRGLTVSTYGVLADTVHVTVPGGMTYTIDITAVAVGAPDEPTDDDLTDLVRYLHAHCEPNCPERLLLAEVERLRAAATAAEQEADQLRPLVKLHQGAHVSSVEAFIGMGDAVMTTIAEGGSLSEVLDVVGDWLSGRDAIDEESEALFDRAKAAAGSPPPTPAPTREQVRDAIKDGWQSPGNTVEWLDAAADAVMALIAQPDREPLWRGPISAIWRAFPDGLGMAPGTAVRVDEDTPS